MGQNGSPLWNPVNRAEGYDLRSNSWCFNFDPYPAVVQDLQSLGDENVGVDCVLENKARQSRSSRFERLE